MLVVEMPVTRSRRQYLAWAAAVLLICSLGIVSVNPPSSQVLSSLNPFEIFRSDKTEAVTPADKTVTAPPAAIVETTPAQPAAEPTAAAAIPTVAPTEIVAAPIVPVSTTTPIVEPKKPQVYYLAIAGSFASKVNARKLMRQLRRKGFETAYILPQTKTRELVKVAALGSPDKAEVIASIDQISKVSGARAWIHKIE